MSAVGFVGAVLAQKVQQIVWCGIGDGQQTAEVHQQAAVAIQYDHPALGCAQREPQRQRRCLAHGAGRGESRRFRLDRQPLERRLVHRHDKFVAMVFRQELQALVAFHHIGLLPTSSTSGVEFA
jgi:hypothetical protein